MDEYIKKESLLSIYKKWLPQLTSKEDEGDRCGVETCIAVLEDLPAADVAPVVHGKWIEEHFGTLIPVKYDDNGNVIVHDFVNYRCNLCGRIECKKEPYCNCGAKMDGE